MCSFVFCLNFILKLKKNKTPCYKIVKASERLYIPPSELPSEMQNTRFSTLIDSKIKEII